MTTADYLDGIERSVKWEPLEAVDVNALPSRVWTSKPRSLIPMGQRRQNRPEGQANRNAYPEGVSEDYYKDTGCDLFPSCLSCPLPQCRYDLGRGLSTMKVIAHDEMIRRLRFREGLTITAIGRRLGISRRTVFRSLALQRAGKERELGLVS